MEQIAAVEQPIAPVAPAPAAEPAVARRLLNDDGSPADGMTPDWKQPAAKAPAAAEPTGDDAPALDAKGQAITGRDGKPLSLREQKNEQRTREAIDRAVAGVRQEYEAKIAALAPKPAVQEPPKPAAAPVEDKEPTSADFPIDQFLDKDDPYEARILALQDARWEWKQRQAAKTQQAETATRTAEQQAFQAVERTFTSYQERENKFKADVPTFDAETLEFRKILNLQFPFDRAVLDAGPAVVRHLALNAEETRRIGQLAASNLPAALRELGKLEAKYDTPAQSAAAVPTPQPKTVTDAPPIGTVLGSQPAAAADASKAAIARKDFRSFDEIETAKDLARLRGGR